MCSRRKRERKKELKVVESLKYILSLRKLSQAS